MIHYSKTMKEARGSKRYQLAPLNEGPTVEEDFHTSTTTTAVVPYNNDNNRKSHGDDHDNNSNISWHNWFKFPVKFSILRNKKPNTRPLLGVLACPLSPLSSDKAQHAVVASSSTEEYIVRQFVAATTGNVVISKNVFVSGKVSMKMKESTDWISGSFIVWYMMPNLWLIEMAMVGDKVVAGSNGKISWRHTSWLGTHVAKGQVRPLRRLLQGLDPVAVANAFSSSEYVGEENIHDEDCFVLKALVNQKSLAERGDTGAEIIRHTLVGYFSQKTGLLIFLEDSNLTRIQSPGKLMQQQVYYWETIISSKMEDYVRTTDGMLIAHSGHSSVCISKTSNVGKISEVVMRMEERWTIEDVAFNVAGLSMDCFIPPSDLIS